MFVLLRGNPYPYIPWPSGYPWWMWAAVGVFLLVWFYIYFVRRRRR